MVSIQIKNAIILYLISIVFWVSIVIYREYIKKDVGCLRQMYIFECDGWCFMHFFHYLLLGYCAPDYLWHLIIIGFLFELVEIPLSNVSKYIDSKVVKDTIVNSFGVICGVLLQRLFPMNINLQKIIFG